jgi:uncharacterized protein YbjQ (UPF0145 family)
MKHYLICPALSAVALMSSHAYARDTVESYSVSAALASEDGKVDPEISLYFAGQPHSDVAQSFGEVTTMRRTNAANKSDDEACDHAFLSAVRALQGAARKQGGNAVINIKSNYRNVVSESATQFKCGAGAFVAGVALKGDVVTLKK